MNFFWDIDNEEFVTGLGNNQKVLSKRLRLRDQVPITLTICGPVSSASAYYEAKDPAAGFSVLFGAKLSTARSDPHLVYQATWTKTGTGIYTAVVDFADSRLIAAIATETELEIVGEFTLVDVDGKNRSSSQFVLTIDADINQGGEPDATGVYLGTNSIAREELIDGKKYILLINSDGIEYARFGPPGA